MKNTTLKSSKPKTRSPCDKNEISGELQKIRLEMETCLKRLEI